MKTSGVSCETKFGLLGFLGHPNVQAILDQKNLTGSAGGAREGQNMAHLGYFNGKCAQMHYFDLP